MQRESALSPTEDFGHIIAMVQHKTRNEKTTVDTKVHRLHRRARSNANAQLEKATKVDDGGGARSKFKRLHEDIQNSKKERKKGTGN